MKIEINLAELYNGPKMRKLVKKEANGWKSTLNQFGKDWTRTGKQFGSDWVNSGTKVASQFIGGRK